MYYDSLKRRVKKAGERRRQEREARELLENLDVMQHIAPVYYSLHEDIRAGEHSTYNLPGGRGSCKSSFASLEIVDGVMGDSTGLSNAIVFRLVGSTLRDSAFAQVSWAIDTLGVSHLWESRVSPMTYTYLPTGAQIIFRGLDDASKLKSIKPRRGTFKYVWFEEFSELPGPNFLRSVQQSVKRGGSGFVEFRTFNPPISRSNWANVHVSEPDSRAVTLLTDYTMIPPEWLGEDFLYEAERLRELNPTAFLHEYMGQPTGSGGDVFPNLEIRQITDEEAEQMEYTYRGVDFGFAIDPACFMLVSYDRKTDTIYLLDEIYEKHCSNAKLAQLIQDKGHHLSGRIPYIPIMYTVQKQKSRAYIVCDSAEPKSIADLNAAGLKCGPCKKFPGCVEYRVKWLQHRKIVIDPSRTPNAHREFTNYQYATDRDGNFLSVLPDADNHSIDAVAYALDTVIYAKGGNKSVSA